MAVEPGLSHQDTDGVPDLPGDRLDVLAHPLHLSDGWERVHAADTSGCSVLAEHLAQCTGPLANGAARACQGDRRRYKVLGRERRRAERVERSRDGVAVATSAPNLEVLELFLLRPLVHHEDVGVLVESLPREGNRPFR